MSSAYIGQLFFIGISGHALTAAEKKMIVEYNIGGIILFGRNIDNPKQISDLCAEIQSLRLRQTDKAPLFIGIDMEGGRVHRLKKPFTQWPPLSTIGAADDTTLSFNFAQAMGEELMAVGINLDFAPCVDVFSNPLNKVIGDRSVSSDVALVEKHASALVRGYIKSGIICCPKHFPGHGDTLIDSHEDLPVEEAGLERLQSRELLPFKKALRARAEMILTAHIRFPNIDPEWPATLSKIFIKKILREDLRYRGLVVTDDLGMGALTKHYSHADIAVRALQVGIDLLLYCNQPEVPPIAYEAVIEAVAQGRLQKNEIEATHQRILAFKKEKLLQIEPPSIETAMSMIGTAEHLEMAELLRGAPKS